MHTVLPAFLHALAPAAAAALVAAAWQGIALAALVALVLRLLPNISAAARSTVWTAVLAVVVLLPFAHAFNTAAPAGVAAHVTPIHVAAFWSLALLALWVAFSLVRLAQLARSALHLRRVSRRATPVETAPELIPLLAAGRRRAQLCLSSEVDRPSVAGFFRPRILLPAGLLAKLSPLDLEQILLHEMEHLKRGDDWINLAQKLAVAVFPLNPALLWIERRLCLERELACDDGVLRATSARKAYATCLASLAEHSLVRRTASLALAAWERQSELAHRVHRILFHAARPMGRRQTAAATSLIAFTLLGGAATLAHAPQLVSFEPAAPPNAIAASSTQLLGPRLTAPAAAVPVSARMSGLHGAHATFVKAILPNLGEARLHQQQPTYNRKPAIRLTGVNTNLQPFRAIQTVADIKPTQQRAAAQPASIAQLDTKPQLPNATAPNPTNAPRAWIVVTRWEYVSNQQPAGVAQPQRSQPDMQPTYAAVATPNGWLIFQL